MLDPDEMAAYEAWKQHKLTGISDLSVSAFNTEQEATALAWAAGVKALHARIMPTNDLHRAGLDQLLEHLLADNPYRKPGMTGYTKHPTRTIPQPEEEDE